jgi:hypothetical protein
VIAQASAGVLHPSVLRGRPLRAFDLGDVDAVSQHADAILDQLASGRMPCYGAWPGEQVAVFRRWVETGKLD